jgi:hypothetical protein
MRRKVLMDRRRVSLVLLLLFVACTGVAIVISGSRPGLQQGVAPAVAQFTGYLFALVAAGLLLASATTRVIGAAVLGALLAMVVLEVVTLDDGGGPDIGGGFIRLAGLVVIMIATVRLGRGLTTAGSAR